MCLSTGELERSSWYQIQKKLPTFLRTPKLELSLGLFVWMGLSSSSALVLTGNCSSFTTRVMATTILLLGLGVFLLLRFVFWRLELPRKSPSPAPGHGQAARHSVVGIRKTKGDVSFVSNNCMPTRGGRRIPFHEASTWRRQRAVLFRGKTSIGEWVMEKDVRTSPFFRYFTPEHRHFYINDGLRRDQVE